MREIAAELGVISHLLRGQPRAGSLAQNLEAFYRPQAGHYDTFRERLLRGRNELIALLPARPGSRIAELGAGTGRNLEFFGARLRQFATVELVDLCPALIAQARKRCNAWNNVRVVEGDASGWIPDEPVDCVYFSYALTMMPDWRGALENALAMLKPGGTLGVVDFYVSQPGATSGFIRHNAFWRWFWSRWFAHDGVHLDTGCLNYLISNTDRLYMHEDSSAIPYLCGLRAPFFIYIGHKRGATAQSTHADERSGIAPE